MKKVLLEAVLVGLLGGALAFVANALSPRGLKLNQNYFPGETKGIVEPLRSHSVAGTNGAALQSLASRLQAKGIALFDNSKVVDLFHDPRYAQNQVVFIDARNDDEFKEGHIPGAHQFDHFHYKKFLPTIIPLCQAAQQIVVYCGGGDNCELSEMAATMLANDLGVAKEKLAVYGGGMNEWKDKGLPIETGAGK